MISLFLPIAKVVEDACMQRESNRQQRGCIYMGNNLSLGKTKKYLAALFSKKVDERTREKHKSHAREKERDLPLFLPRARARAKETEKLKNRKRERYVL